MCIYSDIGVLRQVGAQPTGNITEEDLCLDTKQGDDAELIYPGEVFLLWDPRPFRRSPLFWDLSPSPDGSQDLPQTRQEFGTVLVHIVRGAA